MLAGTYFITGTDTAVGKTVLTALLARHLRRSGVAACAVKPVCSGGRSDARVLRAAQSNALSLDEINPWHFRAPLAPVLAARRAGEQVRLTEVLRELRRLRSRCEVLLIEGAGGLLSPLGEDFDARDLIVELRAVPVVVCRNRLGAVNQALLVMAALPRAAASRARVVLMAPQRPDVSSQSNPGLLTECLGAPRVHVLPWLSQVPWLGRARLGGRIRATLETVLSTRWSVGSGALQPGCSAAEAPPFRSR